MLSLAASLHLLISDPSMHGPCHKYLSVIFQCVSAHERKWDSSGHCMGREIDLWECVKTGHAPISCAVVSRYCPDLPAEMLKWPPIHRCNVVQAEKYE